MSGDLKEMPVVPDGWIEFEYSDPDPDAVAEELQKQARHKLHKPVDSGVDEERGPYDVIPLAMVLGGEAKPATVYKTPMKHLVLDQGIPPRGWYKSKIEADRVRPRPCYTEALLTSPWGGYCPVGCSLTGDTLISIPGGYKQLKDFQVGDEVFGHFSWGVGIAKVLATTKHESLGYYCVELSNGKYWHMTKGHAVWVLEKGWVEIEKLRDNYEEVHLEELREVRKTYPEPEAETMRRLLGASNIGLWVKAYEGDQSKDAASHACQASQSGQRQAEIIGLEVANGGQTCCREDGLSDQQTQSLYEQVRSDLQMPVGVGMVGGQIAGHHGLELEVRKRESGGWSGRVPTRFLHLQPGLVQIDQNSGSEGILSARSTQPYENYAQVFGGQRGAAGGVDWAGAEEIEYITRPSQIVSIRYVEEAVEVYDIQTTSENFYASDMLCHNSFCYINNGSRGYRATGLPTVDPDYPEKYAKQLKRMMVAGAGYMTSFSEIFHKLEDTHHVAERLTQVFVDEGLPIFYCTRRIPMEFAVEALQKNPYSYMQFSINTSNPDDYRKLSPGAAKLDEYYKMINRLHNLGIYVSIQCNPIHPGITSLEELKQLVRELASVGTDHIIFKFVEQVMNTRKVIVDRLASRRFDPKKVDLFDKLFNQVIGGVYTIQQDVRIEWLEELLAETRANHMTMSTCYEYYENGKAGANLAPYFTTSDQCHGRGVPIHYRPAPGEKFAPLPGCYRKGCLYCADHGTRACRSETLLEAKALEYKDLVNTVITGRDEDWDMDESCARPEKEHANPNANPGYMTDAELWNWIPCYTPENKIGQFVPAQEQHSGSKDVIDRAEYEQHI